jgi:hypothetical protein
MDYSLLFCIEKNPAFKKLTGQSKTGSSHSLDSEEYDKLSKIRKLIFNSLKFRCWIQERQTQIYECQWQIHLSFGYHWLSLRFQYG